jgi:hypothetical protein
VTGSTAAAATPSTVAALAQIGLRVAALAQISYMHYRNRGLCREPDPLGTGLYALGTACAERELGRHRRLCRESRPAVPRAHLALVTGPSTTDGVNCGPTSVPRDAEKAHDTEALSAESLWAALGTGEVSGGR